MVAIYASHTVLGSEDLHKDELYTLTALRKSVWKNLMT